MTIATRAVAITLLSVWLFPLVAQARNLESNTTMPVRSEPVMPAPSEQPGAPAPLPSSQRTAPTVASVFPLLALAEAMSLKTEDSELAAREKAASALENFRGGGVYVYFGSGAALVLLIILLIILL